MKVSLIIPIYNAENYLYKCIDSVLNQTFKDLEIILVDDGSNDNSNEICDNYARKDCRIKVIHRNNGGLSAARNTGIVESTGEYVLFIDADDCLYDNSVASLVALVEKYPTVDMVQGNCISQNNVFPNLHYERCQFPEYSNDREFIRKNMLHKQPMTAWNKLTRRQFILEHNLFFLEGIIHEDEMWKWNIQKHIRTIAFCFENTYWYRTDNNTSIMKNADIDRTLSVLNRIEIAKHIISSATDIIERKYAYYFCGPDIKIKFWGKAKNKQAIKNKLNNTIQQLKENNVSFLLIISLYTWYIPLFVINNKLFMKLYYEVSKRL